MHRSRRAKKALLAAAVGTGLLLSHSAIAGGPSPDAGQASNDIVIAEFEGSDWGPWTVQGTAFGHGPARGQRALDLGISGIYGSGAASSEESGGDSPTGTLTSPVFKIERNYISFAICGGKYEQYTCLNLIVGGKVVRSATGDNNKTLVPGSWNTAPFLGKSARIQIVDNATGDWGHINVDHILQTDHPERHPVVTQPLYQETYRPQFHFTARQWTIDKLNPGPREEGWMNDMNGLVYYDHEYHFFAQRWDKCWIHAISRDLVHWTELGVAFAEETPGGGAQSGNCVVDYANTSGLSPDRKTPPMVAFWARGDQKSICLTYSLDHGRTWKFYAHNPVLVYPERDPNVFWHEPTHKWVMAMYGNDRYHIFTSTNLLDWHNENHPIPNSFECPDLFELPVDGDRSRMMWVLIRGNGKYSIGRFDGSEFKEETPQFDSDAGPNFYATQSWGNTNTGDGRRIQAAWMRGGVYPNMPFNQQATFPCELTLHSTPDGPRLHREPIHEIATLHKHEAKWLNLSLAENQTLNLKQPGDLFHIKMELSIPTGASLTLNIRGVPLVMTHTTIACGLNPYPVSSELQSVEILIDRTSIETFANHGQVSISRCFLPANDQLALSATGGTVTVRSLSVFQLNSAWNTGGKH